MYNFQTRFGGRIELVGWIVGTGRLAGGEGRNGGLD